MNKHNAAQFLPLVQALADGLRELESEKYRVAPNPYQHLIDALNAGKVVELKCGPKGWVRSPAGVKDFERYGIRILKGEVENYSASYRVKPDESKEIWVNEYKDGWCSAHASKEKAEKAARNGFEGIEREAVRYVEAKE